MLPAKKYKKNIFFSGQNSHGTSEPWSIRSDYINSIPSYSRIAILIECPTVDVIVQYLRKKQKNSDFSFLKSSTYWWMRSVEFNLFLQSIPNSFHIFGFDTPLNINSHNQYIHALHKTSLPEKNVAISLLEYDLIRGERMVNINTAEREKVMIEKASLVMNADYDHLIVICHSFHASRISWLGYPSLCQTLINKYHDKFNFTSSCIFSRNMDFLATPDGSTLSRYVLADTCSRLKDGSWRVKMISSHYKNEKEDALGLVLLTPDYFDDIIFLEKEIPLTMELF